MIQCMSDAFANEHAEDRVRLLKQNAAQILRIVRETFSNHNFDGSSTRHSNDEACSDGESLEILWTTASKASDASSHLTPVERLQTLVDVRFLTPA